MQVMAQQVAAAAADAVQKPAAVLAADMNSGREMVDAALRWLAENGASFVVNVLVAILLVILGSHVIRLMTRATHKALVKTGRVNTLLQNFLCSVVHKTGWILLVMIVVQRLGVNIAPLIAGLGVTGFILGFAFQETLGNLASGMMVAVNQPFKVGDYVALGSSGIEGTVLELNMMAATLTTGDNKKVVVPNKVVWGSAITNYTAMDKRRVDMTIGIAYGMDIDKARQIALEVMRAHPLVLADPAPIAEVLTLADSAMVLALRPWAKPPDYWTVLFAVNQAVKEAFDKHGIELPFPQLDVYMKS